MSSPKYYLEFSYRPEEDNYVSDAVVCLTSKTKVSAIEEAVNKWNSQPWPNQRNPCLTTRMNLDDYL